MSYSFTPPSFLANQDPDTIFLKMKANVPSDIDASEASFFYDATYPNAIEKAQLIQQQLQEIVKIIFPQYSYSEFLDLHAEIAGLTRKAPNKAAATLTITGVNGTVIPQGYTFATPATQTTGSILFNALSTVTITGGTATVQAQAAVAGIQSNVAAGTITLMFTTAIDGILSITNAAAATGGTETESDDDLLARILKKKQSSGGAGSPSDYEEWALEVPGIGQAFCIPEYLGPGTGSVLLLVIDSNGEPANNTLQDAVQYYILPPNGRGKAPIGATLDVIAPSGVLIPFVTVITPKPGYTQGQCITNIKAALSVYFKAVGVNGTVKYSQAFKTALAAEGVDDLTNFTMDGGTANLALGLDEMPKVGTVNGQ